MRFVTLVYRSIARRRFRSALTLAGVSIAIGAAVMLVGISANFERAFLDTYNRRGVDLVVVRSGAAQRLSSALDEQMGERIRAIPGVKEVTPGLIDVVSFEDRDLYGVLVHGWEVDCFMMDDFNLVEGRLLQPGDERAVILGKVLAEKLQLHTGDVLEIVEEEPYEVVGVYESFTVYENGGMVIPLAELQRLMDWPGQVTGFTVVAEPGSDEAAIETIRNEIEDMNPNVSALAAEDHVEGTTQIKVARAVAWVTSVIALVIGAIGMLNAMLMSVLERTREIGVLRSIGWRKSLVMRMILLESLLISLAGAVVGSLAAAVATRLLSNLPMTSGFIDGQIAWSVFAEGVLIALAVGLLGGAYPALRGASMLPTEALQHD